MESDLRLPRKLGAASFYAFQWEETGYFYIQCVDDNEPGEAVDLNEAPIFKDAASAWDWIYSPALEAHLKSEGLV